VPSGRLLLAPRASLVADVMVAVGVAGVMVAVAVGMVMLKPSGRSPAQPALRRPAWHVDDVIDRAFKWQRGAHGANGAATAHATPIEVTKAPRRRQHRSPVACERDREQPQHTPPPSSIERLVQTDQRTRVVAAHALCEAGVAPQGGLDVGAQRPLCRRLVEHYEASLLALHPRRRDLGRNLGRDLGRNLGGDLGRS
jgi:hypothetical protein